MITETTQHIKKVSPSWRTEWKIKKVNTIESNVKSYQVKIFILNCTEVGVNVSQNLILNIVKVPKSDMHATQI